MKSLNCTDFSKNKKLNFSCEQCWINSLALVFRKKKTKKKTDLSLVNSASELKFTPTVQFPAPREAAKCCFSKTCGLILNFSGSYQWKAFFFLTKRYYVWLRVNLTRSHVTKRHLIKLRSCWRLYISYLDFWHSIVTK